jgi:amidophosphoribosyltransferase
MLICGIVSQFIVLLFELLCSCTGCSIHGLIDIAGDVNEDQMEEGWVISSESCGFLSIGARYEREVRPGEIVEMTKHGIRTIGIVERPNSKPQAFCIFEYVYFARSDSIFEGS